MATDRRKAQVELNSKLQFEQLLIDDLKTFDTTVVRTFTRELLASGSVMDFSVFDEELARILGVHYSRVSAHFGSTISREVSSDAGLTPEEETALAAILSAAFADRAAKQAAVVNSTTGRSAERAAEIARTTQVEDQLSDQEFAATAGNVLNRDLTGRRAAIALTETQASAEFSKQAEAMIFAGAVAANATGGAGVISRSVVKEWVTQGDSRVRQAHLEVDSAQVRIDLPFTVGGQQLMHPGDTSLGATPDNVINCRCSAITDIEAVESSRQDRSS